jgi:methyltransferase (TIGR00027 family)
MFADRQSRTAEYMAFFRALESARPAEERLFYDSFAAGFLSDGLGWVARLSTSRTVARVVDWYADRRSPGARTSGIARTRFIDDCLRASMGAGNSQLVILGAGFDCRAYRLAGLGDVQVFEVDHPATLAVKKERLGKTLPSLPANVCFVPADFNQMGIGEILGQTSFDGSRPAFFLWEGVTNYLSEAAVDAVFRFIAECAAGTKVVFTYVHQGLLDGTADFIGGKRLLEDVARLNEPWTFGIYPEQLSEFLAARGLRLEEDVPAAEYRRRYFGAAAERMKGYEFYRIALATVCPHGLQGAKDA